jgi:hypothetical protein
VNKGTITSVRLENRTVVLPDAAGSYGKVEKRAFEAARERVDPSAPPGTVGRGDEVTIRAATRATRTRGRRARELQMAGRTRIPIGPTAGPQR